MWPQFKSLISMFKHRALNRYVFLVIKTKKRQGNPLHTALRGFSHLTDRLYRN
jgi:hypothetical protein